MTDTSAAPAPADMSNSDPAVMFPDLAAMDYTQLLAERKKLIGDRLTVSALSMDELYRLSAVSHLLRTKNAGPPKAPKTPGLKAAKKAVLSNDDLFTA